MSFSQRLAYRSIFLHGKPFKIPYIYTFQRCSIKTTCRQKVEEAGKIFIEKGEPVHKEVPDMRPDWQRAPLSDPPKENTEKASKLTNLFSFFKKKHDQTPKQKPKKSEAQVLTDARPKKKMPNAEEGVMTHIPKHKAEILSIFQEDCHIYPDEVFPLFPDPKTEQILAAAQMLEGSEKPIEFLDNMEEAKVTIPSNIEMSVLVDEEEEKLSIDKSEMSQTQITDGTRKDYSEDCVLVTKHALAKLKTKKISFEEYMGREKTPIRLTPSVKSKMKTSGITELDRSDSRDLDPYNPFKARKILTPEEVQELYAKSYGEEKDDLVLYDIRQDSHDVWKQSADTINEIIQLLKEHGFKANQSADVWPYTEFVDEYTAQQRIYQNNEQNEAEDERLQTKAGENEDVEEDSLVEYTGLNPAPDTFNDFFLLFSRFPEILTMELNDIRRKLNALEEFQIDDVRVLLLKDPRVLRRPAHHVRKMLEVLDDFNVENHNEIFQYCPYWLASTTKTELKRRLYFLNSEILVEKEHLSNKSANKKIQKRQLDGSTKAMYVSEGEIKTDVKQELSEEAKDRVAEFLGRHPGFIGNATHKQMKHNKFILKSLIGLQRKELNDLLNEYPQILTIHPAYLQLSIAQQKKQGSRNVKQHFLQNIHKFLTYTEGNSRQPRISFEKKGIFLM